MKREFKPGDVALVDSWRGEGQLAFRCERILNQPTWCVLDGTDSRGLSDHEVTAVHPVAVIPFEDHEQVERVAELVRKVEPPLEAGMTAYGRRLQAALREFATPTPPKPEEPLGLGAVVEDVEGVRWVRHSGAVAPWHRADGQPTQRPWRYFKDIAIVKVHSPGVTTDGTP